MVFKFVFLVFLVIVLFYPIYKGINYLYKKLSMIENEDLIDELEKTNNMAKTLNNEINNEISNLKKKERRLSKRVKKGN